MTRAINHFNHFPTTRYQGSKYKLRSWIGHIIKNLDFDTALDAFSGTSSISYTLKEMGKTVYSNDILNFNYYTAKALIENNNEIITEKEINEILTKKENFAYDNFIERTFEDIYFLSEENRWLDIVIQNIQCLSNENKKAMFLWAVYQSAISKRPYNLFHRKNLYIRTSEVKRNFGNKTTWDKSFELHFRKFIQEINNSIFDNNKKHIAYCQDIFDLDVLPDLVYIDTPYIPKKGTLTHYRDFYHFLIGLTDYTNWKNHIDYHSQNKKLISTYSIWEDKKNILNGFEKLIEKFSQSIIVISYRDDGIPDIEEICSILKKYNKKIDIEKIDYQYVLSTKQQLKEVLIIGK